MKKHIIGNNILYFAIFVFLFVFPFAVFSDDSYTLSDVASVQDSNQSGISTMAGSVDSTVDFNGNTQGTSYDYSMQRDQYGNNKVMVTTKGAATMQFLVDTSDMSVTYLMGDGSLKKITLTAEDQAQIQQVAGLNSLPGAGSNLYANLSGNPVFGKKGGLSIKTDASYRQKLDTDAYETDDNLIKINHSAGNKDLAVIEYHNKKVKDTKLDIENKISEAEMSTATKDGAKKLKKLFIDSLKRNKDQILKHLIAKRVDRVNMKTGMVEEQEYFNEEGDRIGHMKVNSKKKFRVKLKAGQNVSAASNGNDKEIELADEIETDMESAEGKSKIKTKMRNMKINEDVKFEWMKIKNK